MPYLNEITLVAIETDDGCDDCVFRAIGHCANLPPEFECVARDRDDHRHVKWVVKPSQSLSKTSKAFAALSEFAKLSHF